MKATILDYNEIYSRILINKPYNICLEPYTNTQIERAIVFFLESEDYEKCKFLKDFIYKNSHELKYKII